MPTAARRSLQHAGLHAAAPQLQPATPSCAAACIRTLLTLAPSQPSPAPLARHELQQQQQHLQQQRCAAAAAAQAAAARRAPPPRDNVASLVERFMDNRRRRQQTIDAHLDEARP